ncbi:MAG: hydroxymethylbilane synthase, partial [Planctomycetales bacterium]|nr:hydroxymethylbilane synthase [Planctomycetales bacterium]
IRGNVETRIAKLDSGEFDGIVLAEAGLRRLGWQDRITEVLSIELMLPAVGQGALGIETRASDTETQTAVAVCNDPETHAAVLAERALLATLRGGCLAPVGAWGRMTDNVLTLDAVVLDKDGTQRLHDSQCSVANPSLDQARQLGVAVAEKLLADGARALIYL